MSMPVKMTIQDRPQKAKAVKVKKKKRQFIPSAAGRPKKLADARDPSRQTCVVFAENLHGLRLEKGLSQQTLAKKLGIRQAQVSVLEHPDKCNPKLEVICRILQFFRCPPERLFLKNNKKHDPTAS